MKRVTLSKLNPTQRKHFEELIDLCCRTEPIRLSIPLPEPGKELRDERFFALYADGAPVSLIHLFYPDHVIGELIGFTHPDHRGQGYFRDLLDLAADYADQIGLEQVYVISDGNSADANQALNHLGLEVEYAEYMLEKALNLANAPQPADAVHSRAEAPTIAGIPGSDCAHSNSLTVTEASVSPLTASLFSDIFHADIAQCEAYLEEITTDERIHTYVLNRNNDPIGQTQLTFIDDMVYISGFGILPEYRRQGFGRMFLCLLENHLTIQGFAKLTLQVSSKNKPALSLYRKDGFETLEALSYYPLFEEG